LSGELDGDPKEAFLESVPESEFWNIVPGSAGLHVPELTGEDEARKVGRRLHGIPFAHVLTSPLQRAQQTCALAALGPKPKIEPDLTEWDNGEDEGHTPAEILQSRPGWNLFRDGSPRGETPGQISARADRFITRLRTLDGDVALFSHSHFGRVLAARWIGLPVGQAQHFLLDTAAHSVLCCEHNGTGAPAIELWNAVAGGPQ